MPAARTAFVIGLALTAVPAVAFEPMQGCFVARQACEASVSTRRLDNPGDIRLDPGRTYRLLGANKADATHFEIELPDASPKARWVEAGCGRPIRVPLWTGMATGTSEVVMTPCGCPWPPRSLSAGFAGPARAH